MREAIGLAERALSLTPEPELALELAGWWIAAGDLIRGAALRHAAVSALPLERRVDELLKSARHYARAAQLVLANQALRQAMELDEKDPRVWEMHGSFGFWSDLPVVECARSYLRAADLRRERDEEGLEFQNLLCAFEVAPAFDEAAAMLSKVLCIRGRPGAADEILREHHRQGSAAQRAAHHQRAFYTAIVDRKFSSALESAFEAELDVELDPGRLEELLSDDQVRPSDFEGFLLELIRTEALGASGALVQWLLALVKAHLFDWGEARVARLSSLIALAFQQGQDLDFIALQEPQSESRLRDLRRCLAAESDVQVARDLREEIALRECARGQWGEAHHVLEPLLTGRQLSLSLAAMALFVSSRARKPLGRARALSALAHHMPTSVGAVAHAVASEMLLLSGFPREARAAATSAVEAEPRNVRALASQALVALGAPEAASEGLLERSLSVLVARADACTLLCRSADDAGSPRLALSWAGRALALRPGDLQVRRSFLRQACRTQDIEKISAALSTVLNQPAPTAPLCIEVARAIEGLSELSSESFEKVGMGLLEILGVRSSEVLDALVLLAKTHSSHALSAAITERRLVTAPATSRAALSLVLSRQRLSAGQHEAAARSLRRALAQGAELALVRESVKDFDRPLSSDGKLAMLEIQAEILDGGSPAGENLRAQAIRRVGAARFDMAQDTAGTIQLLLKAAEIDLGRGLEFFAHYLHHLMGPEATVRHLKAAALKTEEPMRSGQLLGFAARELFELGRRAEAFDVAVEALQRAPLLTELLSVVESCAAPEQLDVLLDLYTLLADSSMGSYGERAVHYHAARNLDERGFAEKALDHACLAFEAVPSEGVAFVLMARLAQSTAGQDTLQATLQRVAEKAQSDDERARWLSKAAALVDPESAGRRQRVEILMRAAQMAPDEKSLQTLFEALARLLAEEPDAKKEMWERFRRLSTEVLRHGSGAHGAQLSILLANAGVQLFENTTFGLSCLTKAVKSNIEIPEYQLLLPHAPALALLQEPASEFVRQVRGISDKREAPLGGGLAQLAGRLAELLNQRDQKSELLVRAASDFPEDSELVSLARYEARLGGREDLLQEIESLLPVAEQVLSVLDRLPDLSSREGLDALLTLDLDAASEEQRAQILEKMGEGQEELKLFEDAAASYRELAELRPQSSVAVCGLERDAERSGNHEELARILKLRSDMASDPDSARRLHLRRAVVLETKLGRASEARESLSVLLEDQEDRSALRMLADSWERAGDYAEAAELWVRVQKVARNSSESDDASYRAASCFFESGTAQAAAEALDRVLNPTVIHRTLGLAVARSLGENTAILRQLVALAQMISGDGAQAGELYLEASHLSLLAHDAAKARYCAGHALRLLPESSEIQLMSLRLRLQQEPAFDGAEEATKFLEELKKIGGLTSAADREVFAYLWAQCLAKSESSAVAATFLEQALSEQGARPLLSLALGDLSEEEPRRALALYELAIGAELYGFVLEGEVLLRAGRTARNLGELDRAQAFVSAVGDQDPVRKQADLELRELSAEQEELEREAQDRARELETEAIRKAAEEEAAAERRAAVELRKAADEKLALAEQAARKAAAEEATRKEEAEEERRLNKEAAAVKAVAREAEEQARLTEAAREASVKEARAEHRQATIAVSEHQELVQAPRRKLVSSMAVAASDFTPLEDELLQELVPERLPDLGQDFDAQVAIDLVKSERNPSVSQYSADDLALDGEVDSEKNPVPSSFRRVELPPSRHPPKTEREDAVLVAELEKGDIDAGLELLERLQGDRSRAREAMIVAQRLVSLEPGDASILGSLVTTASRDGNQALALAVRHILGAYGVGDEKSAPSLSRLVDQGEAARALSMQGATSSLHEALALVWEHASAHFKREILSYGVSGVERVPLSATTAFGELYRGTSRLLGMGRTPVFRVRGQGDLSMQVALLTPPAVIVSGEIPEGTNELSFHFGAMLAAANPEHALTFGCPPEELQRLLDALALSFGSGRTGPDSRPDAEVTRVASFFWESIPSRAQRRLSQLCRSGEDLTVAALAASSRRVLRRAGLLACGDLPTAVADACGEAGLPVPGSLPELAECVARSPSVADLFALAVSPEYAEIRFRSV